MSLTAPRLIFLCVAASLVFGGTAEANPYRTTKSFTVTSNGSSRLVPGTLNWAVFQANYTGADVNYINFNIPSLGGEVDITLSEPLYVARLMILDGTTQPGYSGKPLIRINAAGMDSAIVLAGNVAGVPPYSDGSTATGGGNPGVHGVSAATAGSTIQGFQIFNYAQNAITIFKEAEGNFIQKNWMGFTSVLGTGVFTHNTTAHPGSRGIGIQSNFNTIRSNTISGVSNGIVIGEPIETAWSGRNYFTNALENNNIGTDPTGSVVIGNDSDGVFLGAGGAENFIGPNNVISGMASSGVELLHPSNYGNIIISNLIGVNRAGTAVLGNGELGVLIANGADYNDVGGPSGGNVLSGNHLGGVVIGTPEYPAPCTRIYVESNLIGTDATGLRSLGGQISGITSQNGSEAIINRNVVAAESNHGIVLNGVGQTTAVRNGQTIKLANAVFGNWIGVSASASPLVFNGPAGPGVQLLTSPSTTDGLPLPNLAYGIYVLNSFGNYIQIPAGTENPSSRYLRNIFGTNILGPVGFNGCTAADNIFFP
ncbi:MAG: hypothetical protein QOH88_3095 [Verrucomicrobiota bacterium]|jgi:hypothetical protein